MSSNVFKEARPLAPTDQYLVELYNRIGRPVDALPYTPEFDDLYRQFTSRFPDWSQHQVLSRLFTLRKAARLPRLGGSASPIPASDADLTLVSELADRFAGRLGQRDRLPYTPEFDKLVAEFNKVRPGPPLDPYAVWRLVARVAK